MEHDDTKLGARDFMQMAFIILLAVAIGAIMFACITLIRNADEIKVNPVQYSVDNNFYDYCTCYNEGEKSVVFASEDKIIKNMVIQNWTG